MKKLITLLFLFVSTVIYSQTYTPKNNAVLGSSLECINKAYAAIAAGDKAGFQRLADRNCILIYQSSMNLNLVLLKVGKFGNPNVYYISGKPDEKIWAYADQFEELLKKYGLNSKNIIE